MNKSKKAIEEEGNSLVEELEKDYTTKINTTGPKTPPPNFFGPSTSRNSPELKQKKPSQVQINTQPAVSTDACSVAASKLREALRLLPNGGITPEHLRNNLTYAVNVLETVYWHDLKRTPAEEDVLPEVESLSVLPEVRDWLSSTFTRRSISARSTVNPMKRKTEYYPMYRRVMPVPKDVTELLKGIDDWLFDIFALEEAANGLPMKYMGYEIFTRYQLISKFKIVPNKLEMFLTKIEAGYRRHNNTYHNNVHAADVAQTVHFILKETRKLNWLTDLEIFALFLAALVHDFDHTGTTNNFHVMTNSDMAMMYNDRSVLENHHVSCAFRLLRTDECNVLSNLPPEEYRQLRSLVIELVLSTDMSFHSQVLRNMRNVITLGESDVNKTKALSLLLHGCDISQPGKSWNLHCRWTMSLMNEFFHQGDLERALELPFSPLCDRNTVSIPDSQVAFIDFIVEPVFTVVADMLEYVLAPMFEEVEEKRKSRKSIKAVCEENVEQTTPAKFTIVKPWTIYIALNKKIWEERAEEEANTRKMANIQMATASVKRCGPP